VRESEAVSLTDADLAAMFAKVGLQTRREQTERLSGSTIAVDDGLSGHQIGLLRAELELRGRELLAESATWRRRTKEHILMEIVHEVIDNAVSEPSDRASLLTVADTCSERLLLVLASHVQLAAGPAGRVLDRLSPRERQLLRALGIVKVKNPMLAGRWLGWNSLESSRIWEQLRHQLDGLV